MFIWIVWNNLCINLIWIICFKSHAMHINLYTHVFSDHADSNFLNFSCKCKASLFKWKREKMRKFAKTRNVNTIITARVIWSPLSIQKATKGDVRNSCEFTKCERCHNQVVQLYTTKRDER